MTGITIPTKNTGDPVTAAEWNQFLEALKDGTRDINAALETIKESNLNISNDPVDGDVLQYKNATDKMTWVAPSTGSGDMTKTVYDSNDDGTVDSADTAAALTGSQADAIVANTAKISFDSASSTRLANTSGTNTGDQDLSSYLTISSAASTYEPLKGADDNFVTDAEKIVIGNTSGINTGDQDLSGKQDNITLTTTGTSGAATLIGSTLNIPQYTAGGGGDVVKVGTPVDNQLAIWTGDGTVEGDPNLVWDGTNLTFATGTLNGIAIGGTYPSWMGDNGIYITGTLKAKGYLIDDRGLVRWGDSKTQIRGTASSPDYSIDFKLNNIVKMTLDETTGLTVVDNISANNLSGTNTGDNPGLENVSEDLTPQLGGNLDLNNKGIILSSQTVGGVDGNLVYLSGSETWSQADASAESTCSNMLAIRLNSTSVLTKGVYTTTGLTAGSIYYVSETSGAITTTKPTTSTTIVRIIGYALSTTKLYFDPDKTYVVLA